MSPFPENIRQIDNYLFTSIMFYKQGQEFKQIELKYVNENEKLIKKLFVYGKQNDRWIEEKTTSFNNVYEIIATYSS